MKVILVPVADRPECARALNVAFDLGNRLDASVVGCHIRPHSYSHVSLSPKFAAEFYGIDGEQADTAWRKKSTKKASVAAKKLFCGVAESQGYEVARRPRKTTAAVWDELVGSPDRMLRIAGPMADLIVVSRPPARGGEIARIFMLCSVMDSGRPVLILPQRGGRRGLGRNVCIAWNQSVEAARAVSAALPILRTAEKVTIVHAGKEDRVGPKAVHLVNYLRAWNVKADQVGTPGLHVEKDLLDCYDQLRADLLVMGAYSRSRWRERLFGGTSRFMLNEARIPVFVLHA